MILPIIGTVLSGLSSRLKEPSTAAGGGVGLLAVDAAQRGDWITAGVAAVMAIASIILKERGHDPS